MSLLPTPCPWELLFPKKSLAFRWCDPQVASKILPVTSFPLFFDKYRFDFINLFKLLTSKNDLFKRCRLFSQLIRGSGLRESETGCCPWCGVNLSSAGVFDYHPPRVPFPMGEGAFCPTVCVIVQVLQFRSCPPEGATHHVVYNTKESHSCYPLALF